MCHVLLVNGLKIVPRAGENLILEKRGWAASTLIPIIFSISFNYLATEFQWANQKYFLEFDEVLCIMVFTGYNNIDMLFFLKSFYYH